MQFFNVIVLTLVMMAGPFAQAQTEATVQHPNILFISIDDLRPELGCYGAEHMITPNIDALSAKGVTFDRAYVQVAVCNPSRASTFTGMRPDRLHVYTLRQHFRETVPDVVTLPQYLRSHGYTSHGLGKIFHNPWQDPRSWSVPHTWTKASFTNYSPEQLAFRRKVDQSLPDDTWFKGNLRGPITNAPEIDDSDHADGRMTRVAMDRLEQLSAGDEPFFLAVGYLLPHLPWCPPKSWWDRYDRDALPMLENTYPPKDSPKVASDTSYEISHYADMIDMPTPYTGTLSEARTRRLRHGYFAAVSFIDAQVGLLMKKLDDLGLAGNTIVVLWSDHGYKLGEHNGWGKMTNYEIDTRIPMIILDPRAKANGQRTTRIVESLDLYPTLCELAGLPTPKHAEGKSMVPLLNDTTADHTGVAFSQYTRNGLMGNAMRTDRWHYIEWRRLTDGGLEHRELYDHKSDPQENQNVVTAHDKLADQLAQRMAKTLKTGAIDLRGQVRSEKGDQRVSMQWINRYNGQVRITWINTLGHRQNVVSMNANDTREFNTTIGHAFAVESIDGKYFEVVRIKDDRDITIGNR
jgi:iduronate 2-sulfatase